MTTAQHTFEAAVQHHQAGRLAEAERLYRLVLAQQPRRADAMHNLGVLAHHVGRDDVAMELFRQAVAIDPDYAEAQNSLGNALRNAGKSVEAITAYRHAIHLRPEYSEAYSNLGLSLKDVGELDEAMSSFRRAIAIKPGSAEAYCNLGNALRDQRQLDEAIDAYRQAIALRPGYAEAHSSLVFALHYSPAYDAQMIAAELRNWNRQHAEPLGKSIGPHSNERSPDRRLRIGYVSPDLRNHVVGRNIFPLFEQHDRELFEITCYSNDSRTDTLTAEFQRHSDRWCNIVGLSDEQVANQIRTDRIDILVDLALHTAGGRLLVFARKPAPVQVTFAGYPGSTGLSAMDYRLSDPYLDPADRDESIYSEKTIRLPDSFWCYDPLDCQDISVNSLPALQAGYVTFGCFNSLGKINDEVLSLWARVLKRVENSRLLMLTSEGSHRQRTLERLEQEGIDPKRIGFVLPNHQRGYLESYHQIDIGLDSFPYNGHTTSLDSFWMGVPVVTLVGQTAVSRAGWCQLSNLALAELAGHTAEQFVEIASALANDLPRLSELRRTLRERMQQSPLMDAPKFARNIEAAYRQMWRAWCENMAR